MGAESRPATPALESTPRTTLRRKRERGSHDLALVYEILDEGLVAHVAVITQRGPVVLPMAYARIGDQLYLHGAAANDLLRTALGGSVEPGGGGICVTVTLIDGIVFARSAFHHSMNYRCAVLFGPAERVTDRDEMLQAAAALLDHVAPGRSRDARAPDDGELRSTLIMRLAISEGSAKVRAGGPIDDAADLDLAVWAGVLPVALAAGEPHADAAPTAAGATALPDYVASHRLHPRRQDGAT